jgi:hypothetical protein
MKRAVSEGGVSGFEELVHPILESADEREFSRVLQSELEWLGGMIEADEAD